MERSIQIEQEEINEAETKEEIKETTGQNDRLNLGFEFKEPAEKKRKINLKLSYKKITGCNTNLTQI